MDGPCFFQLFPLNCDSGSVLIKKPTFSLFKTLLLGCVVQWKLMTAYFWQKSCPQFLQWWRLSVRENRTEQPEQLSPPSSFTQWSAADLPGWSLTDQLNTLPRPSPTRILLWSLQEHEWTSEPQHTRFVHRYNLITSFWLNWGWSDGHVCAVHVNDLFIPSIKLRPTEMANTS